jgi:hypothetical protein
MSRPDLAPPQERWTHIEEYLGALARRRTARRSRRTRSGERTEPEAPSLVLSTLPFAVLMVFMGLMIVAFAVAAWPPSQRGIDPPDGAQSERGTARPGWFDEAKKEMR